jgi:ATP-binding cassette subfamily B protein RaxB
MGSSLSGGQRQRVLLARALYRRPTMLFMDEGTSHLDTNIEARVNAAIRELGLTRIIIAHRPETIASAERRIAIVDGQLHEQPQPDSISRRNAIIPAVAQVIEAVPPI